MEDGRPSENELEDDPTDKPMLDPLTPKLEPLIPKPEPPVDLLRFIYIVIFIKLMRIKNK